MFECGFEASDGKASIDLIVGFVPSHLRIATLIGLIPRRPTSFLEFQVFLNLSNTSHDLLPTKYVVSVIR